MDFVNWIATKFNLILPQIDACDGGGRGLQTLLRLMKISIFEIILSLSGLIWLFYIVWSVCYCVLLKGVCSKNAHMSNGGDYSLPKSVCVCVCVFRPITVSITDEWIRPNGRIVNVISEASIGDEEKLNTHVHLTESVINCFRLNCVW